MSFLKIWNTCFQDATHSTSSLIAEEVYLACVPACVHVCVIQFYLQNKL